MRIIAAIVVLGLCASPRAQTQLSPDRPNSRYPGPGVSYLPRTWPEGRCRPGRLLSPWPTENAVDLYVTNPPMIGSPLGARITTGAFSNQCDASQYFGMLLLAHHEGNVMPNGHGIQVDGQIRLGVGTECAISVVPQNIVYLHPRHGLHEYDIELAPGIPNDPQLVGITIYMQVALAPDFSCGPPSGPWGPPRLPDYALVTSNVMRVEVQHA